ncbi:copper chaperone PCu(A)C [Luteimonas yindakuii]|uniref:copper chaperone PCu(A)C n=1 Tax=Luteimonas yindakuii TaxID=2565782 RepID=UPI0010A2DBFC|nr:copper chaperone PCu(A)C [Luteimonas yindakuii]QCO67844.1 copper chaperone PCu(A)C [Luteimonas yindakuii]
MNIRDVLLSALAALSLAACNQPTPPPTVDAPPPGLDAAADADAGAGIDPAQAGIAIETPWIRLPPPPAAVAAGYLGIRNSGDSPDRLLAVETDAAARVEIHEMREEDGMMRMRQLEAGIELPSGAHVELKPGGYHLMLMEPQADLAVGGRVPAVLVFEHAGRVPVEFEVRSATGQGTHGGGHGGDTQ